MVLPLGEDVVKSLRDTAKREQRVRDILKAEKDVFLGLKYEDFYELFSVACLHVRRLVVEVYSNMKRTKKAPKREMESLALEMEFATHLLLPNSHYLRGNYFVEEVHFLSLLATLLLRDGIYDGKVGKPTVQKLKMLGSSLLFACYDFIKESDVDKSSGLPSPSSIVSALSTADPDKFMSISISKKAVGELLSDNSFNKLCPPNLKVKRSQWESGSLRVRRGIMTSIAPALLFGGMLVMILPMLTQVFDSQLGMLLGLGFDLYITAVAVINIFSKPREYEKALNEALAKAGCDIFEEKGGSFFAQLIELIGHDFSESLVGEGIVQVTVKKEETVSSPASSSSVSSPAEGSEGKEGRLQEENVRREEREQHSQEKQGEEEREKQGRADMNARAREQMLSSLLNEMAGSASPASLDADAVRKTLQDGISPKTFELPPGVNPEQLGLPAEGGLVLAPELKDRFKKLRSILEEDDGVSKEVADRYLSVLRALPLEDEE